MTAKHLEHVLQDGVTKKSQATTLLAKFDLQDESDEDDATAVLEPDHKSDFKADAVQQQSANDDSAALPRDFDAEIAVADANAQLFGPAVPRPEETPVEVASNAEELEKRRAKVRRKFVPDVLDEELHDFSEEGWPVSSYTLERFSDLEKGSFARLRDEHHLLQLEYKRFQEDAWSEYWLRERSSLTLQKEKLDVERRLKTEQIKSRAALAQRRLAQDEATKLQEAQTELDEIKAEIEAKELELDNQKAEIVSLREDLKKVEAAQRKLTNQETYDRFKNLGPRCLVRAWCSGSWKVRPFVVATMYISAVGQLRLILNPWTTAGRKGWEFLPPDRKWQCCTLVDLRTMREASDEARYYQMAFERTRQGTFSGPNIANWDISNVDMTSYYNPEFDWIDIPANQIKDFVFGYRVTLESQYNMFDRMRDKPRVVQNQIDEYLAAGGNLEEFTGDSETFESLKAAWDAAQN